MAQAASPLVLTMPLLAAACVSVPEVAPSPAIAPLAVTSTTGVPFTFADGALAKRQADAQCGGLGVQTSIYDRYQAGAWVFVGGCA